MIKLLKTTSLLIAATAMLLTFFACALPTPDDGDIDLADPMGRDGVVTAAQLINAVEEGATELTLAASIDLENEMLKLDRPNATLKIKGSGFGISGNGDCVIRLAEGCTLLLEDITLTAGSCAIGCLGSATLGGQATVNAVAHAINAEDLLQFTSESRYYIKSNVGSAIYAKALTLESNARVLATGGLGGADVYKDDIVLENGAVLDANTDDNYNALKCAGTLVMADGSTLIVTNNGEYHGAEISDIFIEGTVTINAKGGSKGVGLFLFELNENYCVVGFCEPGMRFETGEGGLGFYKSAADFPAPEPSMTPEGDVSEDAEG